MESQFILKLPDKLKNINLLKAKLTKLNDKSVELEYNNEKYEGFIVRPPTIIESHKILDGKLYKIADINSVVVIKDKDVEQEVINKEIKDMEVSGITPPMKYCKLRRFKKNPERLKLIKEIEESVQSLIDEDEKAIKVEIINPEVKEVDDIAAEIENELKIDEDIIEESIDEDFIEEELEEELIEDNNDVLLKQIKEKEDLIKLTTNPILKKRYEHTLKELYQELEKSKK
ncbi:TAF7 [Hepatospora eriocheir]|uniref:TAF7 n=1 Tax=Hepatospora eriocheir TaxID=1081669 RepID=A0A1X0QC15_9MICR|nr:TAF7 [Hepatospora eriocheir]